MGELIIHCQSAIGHLHMEIGIATPLEQLITGNLLWKRAMRQLIIVITAINQDNLQNSVCKNHGISCCCGWIWIWKGCWDKWCPTPRWWWYNRNLRIVCHSPHPSCWTTLFGYWNGVEFLLLLWKSVTRFLKNSKTKTRDPKMPSNLTFINVEEEEK